MSPITLIPPDHEQSVFTFHVEEPLVHRFIEHLAHKGLVPWRPPVNVEKAAPDGEPLIQVEVDTASTEEMLQDLINEFLGKNEGVD